MNQDPGSRAVAQSKGYKTMAALHSLTAQIQATKAYQTERAEADQIKRSQMEFLKFPREVRNLIWRFIQADADNDRYELGRKPQNPYIGFLLSCRQVYHESHSEWLRSDVPWSRLKGLLDFKSLAPANQLHSLVLQIPQTAAQSDVLQLARFLKSKTQHLRELRLYFYGRDMYYQSVYAHGCGNLAYRDEPILHPHAQRWQQFRPLWSTIRHLQNLEILVVCDANLQLTHEMIMSANSRLSHLVVTTDPRSTPLASVAVMGVGTTFRPPPMKALNLSANTFLRTMQVTAMCLDKLEHLSWTIPARQSNDMMSHWYRQTAILLGMLRGQGHRLHTLRMCFGRSRSLENDVSYHALMHAFMQDFHAIPCLRRFELHATIGEMSTAFDILESVPPTVERLYLSDNFILPRYLRKHIAYRILTGRRNPNAFVLPPLFPSVGYYQSKPGDGRYGGGIGSSTGLNGSSSKAYEPLSDRLPTNKEPWFISFEKAGDYSYDRISDLSLSKWSGYRLIPRRGESESGSFLGLRGTPMVGEDLSRRDFIDLHRFALQSVDFELETLEPKDDYKLENFEFKDDNELEKFLSKEPDTNWKGISKILWINGRLHDRQRHISLYPVGIGRPIKPAMKESDARDRRDYETASCSGHQSYAVMLFQYITDIETQYPRDTKSIAAEWALSRFSISANAYFGGENHAQKFFEAEPVARAEELPEPFHPVVEDVWPSDQCRWACPDAVLPTLAERGAL